jgi:hypothetical protein
LEVRAVAEAHRLATRLGSGNTMPLGRNKPSEGKTLQRLAAEGLTIGSRRVTFLRDEPVTAVAGSIRGRPATLMILSAAMEGSLAVNGVDRGISVIGWNDGEATYLLASEAPRADLERLVERAAVAVPVESFAGQATPARGMMAGLEDLQ